MTTLGCLSSPMLSKLCDTAARPVKNRAVGPAQPQRCDSEKLSLRINPLWQSACRHPSPNIDEETSTASPLHAR